MKTIKLKYTSLSPMTMKSKDMTNKHKGNFFLYGKECHNLPEIWPVAGSRIVQTWQFLVQVIALLGPARMAVFQVFLYVFSPVSNPILPQPKYIRSYNLCDEVLVTVVHVWSLCCLIQFHRYLLQILHCWQMKTMHQ